MAKHKCNCPDEGAPLWVLTYGDMMSLLLVFFILLLSLSELRRPPETLKALQDVQANFKTQLIPGTMSQIIRKTDVVLIEPNRSNSDEQSIDGKDPAVTTVRPSMQYTIGGRVIFENRSDQLSDEAKAQITTFGKKIVGLNTKLELTGHTNPLELGEDASEQALWDLSYRRARAVQEFLVQEVGIKTERIRLIASADHEPIVQRAYSPEEQQNNRRVTIVSLDTLVEELAKPELH
jgi:chemotaxis protein MotB